MRSPQFTRQVINRNVTMTAANAARDGSGTLSTLLNVPFITGSATADNTTDKITVASWSRLSNLDKQAHFDGDRVRFVSGTMPTGITSNTDYIMNNQAYDSVNDIMVFEILDATTLAQVTFTTNGSALVIGLYTTVRIEGIRFISSQATAAASSAMVVRTFISDNQGANPAILDESSFATLTPSTTAVGQKVDIVFYNALLISSGQILSVAKSVHAGSQDNVAALLINAGIY